MVSASNVSGTRSVGAVALAEADLDVVVTGVVLQVTLAADGSTVSARGFLLGGSTSLGRLYFRFER